MKRQLISNEAQKGRHARKVVNADPSRECQDLCQNLNETDAAIDATSSGGVDALIVTGSEDNRVYALQSSDYPYRVLVDVMNEGVLTLNRDGTILWCNNRFTGFLQIPVDLILGRRLHQFMTPASARDLDAFLQNSTAAGGAMQAKLSAADGGKIPVNLSARAFDLGSHPALCIVVSDLTETIASSEAKMRLALIVENSNDAVLSRSFDGRILTWNAAAERIFGYTEQEAVGKNIQTIVASEWQSGIRHVNETIMSGDGLADYEVIGLTKDGRRVPMSLTGSPLKDGEGNLIGLSIIARDITERKQAEDMLRRAHDELEARVSERTAELQAGNALLRDEIAQRRKIEEELCQVRDELERRVSERTADLSNTVWTLQNEVALRKKAEETLRRRTVQLRALAAQLTAVEQRERQRLAMILHDNIQQLLVAARFRVSSLVRTEKGRGDADVIAEISSLLDECLDASRSLTMELCPPIIKQSDLIPALEWLTRRMHERHGINIELVIRNHVRIKREDVRIFLFESVRELLFNVVKHAQVNAASVAVAQIDNCVEITVTDEGAGFDASQWSAHGCEGAEIGLFHIRERLDLLGGTFKVTSAPGQGSSVIVVIPLLVDSTPIESTKTAPKGEMHGGEPPPKKAGSRAGGKISVLLVDDHAVLRQLLAITLSEEHDLEIVGEAFDGKQAIELTRRLKPRVIVMDINLPGISGIEATRVIHKEFPEIKIVGLSMYEEKEMAEAMRQAGASAYVTKSGPLDALVTAIRSHAR